MQDIVISCKRLQYDNFTQPASYTIRTVVLILLRLFSERSVSFHFLSFSLYIKQIRGGWAQWVARLTRNVEVVGSSPIKGSRFILDQETLPLLLRTGWFQERIRAWFHNQTKINWGPYGRFFCLWLNLPWYVCIKRTT